MLYPLRFKPITKEVIWGGDKLVKAGKRPLKDQNPELIGESWELSGVEGNLSVVKNGVLRNNNLQELTEVYMGELVGDGVFDKYGLEFPLLLKYIDARDRLSVQVHPTDELAEQRHGCRGKTEMWYVVDAEQGAVLYVGFKGDVTAAQYREAIAKGRLTELLNPVEVKRGDTYFIPAGTLHAIGAGVLIAEIQETSDITYRVSDWGRTDRNGKARKLHIEESYDAVDFGGNRQYCVTRRAEANRSVELVGCPYFTVNLLRVEGAAQRDYAPLDSFVAYMCVEGEVEVKASGRTEKLKWLDTILLPAEITDVELTGNGELLEIYVGKLSELTH